MFLDAYIMHRHILDNMNTQLMFDAVAEFKADLKRLHVMNGRPERCAA